MADIYRQDVQDAGKGDGCYGFAWKLPVSAMASGHVEIAARVAGTDFILTSPFTISGPEVAARLVKYAKLTQDPDLMSDVGPGSGHYVELQEAKLFGLIRFLLESVEVDEDWYLKTNPDVAAAVQVGDLKSGRAHYIISGYFENRLPRPVVVDETWYLAEYPDVADAIRGGMVASASAHFEKSGFVEGRLPREDWSLLRDAVGEAKLSARAA